MIQMNHITLMIAGKEFLTDSSCQISDGQKIGIIGDNGCGKSTLFKAILNQVDLLQGTIEVPQNTTIAFVEQEITQTDVPILQFVLEKDVKLKKYREKLLSAKEEELAEIHDQLNLLHSESAESRVASILSGLGFTQEDLSLPVHHFSGGWRMRLALAGALFQNSDILLLDEPTNHLDLEATIWLESYLKKYPGTLLVISHDQDFLNHNCTSILHFENKKLVLYGGNYHTFQKTYALKNKNLKKQAEKEAEKRAHLQSFIDRFRYKATKAKQAQSRLKMLEKMGEEIQLVPDKEDVFVFPEVENLPAPYLRLDNVSVGYSPTPVLKRLNLSLGANERIALLGRNGNGKSTLAKLLNGDLSPMEGTLFRSSKLRIGFFNQHQNEILPLEETPLSYMTHFMSEKSESQVRSYLANFGLEQEKSLTQISVLSGGEKARLVLAKICLNKPHLLILDEPTNHLDMKGREALIHALNAYQGSVILITHDFHILESVCDTLWLVQNHTCQIYTGSLTDYRHLLMEKEVVVKEKKQPISPVVVKKPSKSTLMNKIQKVEKQLEALQKQRQELQDKFLSDKKLDYALLNREFKKIETQIREQESLWETLAEQL